MILLTGASGLIGHCILDYFKDHYKSQIIALYRHNKPSIDKKNILYAYADLTQEHAWYELNRFSADTIIHCAAVIPESCIIDNNQHVAKQQNMTMDNFAITYATKKNSKLIYMSSSGVYGYSFNYLCDENSPLNPQGEYFIGKLETENSILSLNNTLKYFIFRISSPFGSLLRNNTVMSIFIRNALQNRPILYYGTGSRTQDFIYAKDIARACFNAINCENYGIYNIASGTPISMKELAELIKSITASQSEIKSADIADPQETFKANFGIQKANALLQWQPHYTLEQGLQDFIRHTRFTVL